MSLEYTIAEKERSLREEAIVPISLPENIGNWSTPQIIIYGTIAVLGLGCGTVAAGFANSNPTIALVFSILASVSVAASAFVAAVFKSKSNEETIERVNVANRSLALKQGALRAAKSTVHYLYDQVRQGQPDFVNPVLKRAWKGHHMMDSSSSRSTLLTKPPPLDATLPDLDTIDTVNSLIMTHFE